MLYPFGGGVNFGVAITAAYTASFRVLLEDCFANERFINFPFESILNATVHEPSPITRVKSIFLPGLGQMGKHRGGSGFFTLMGEVVFVGGAFGSYDHNGARHGRNHKEASRIRYGY